MKAFCTQESEKHTSPHSFLGPVGRRHSGIGEAGKACLLSEWLSTGRHCTQSLRQALSVSLQSGLAATIAAFLPSFLSRGAEC